MRYTIIYVDDSRSLNRHRINVRLTSWGWTYFENNNVDGRVPGVLENEIPKHGYEINADLRSGQLGVWYSVINSLEHAPHVTIEDDGILGRNFNQNFMLRTLKLPKNADFFSLFIPRDSDHMYKDDLAVNNFVTRVYQNYGGVSMLYTERGASNIKRLLREEGITGQYDDTLYRWSKEGKLNGYCSKPSLTDLIYIDGNTESIVQNSEYFRRK